jgi:hypothetical protein
MWKQEDGKNNNGIMLDKTFKKLYRLCLAPLNSMIPLIHEQRHAKKMASFSFLSLFAPEKKGFYHRETHSRYSKLLLVGTKRTPYHAETLYTAAHSS